MPDGKKEQSELFDISQSYVDAMFALIADETPGGAERFTGIALKALEEYESVFYARFTRGRSNEVRMAIEEIKKHPEAVKRMPEFRTLIQKGKWETTSYNFYLFVALIKELGGYDYLYQNNVTKLYVDLLRDAVFKQIDYFMNEQERLKASMNQRQAELNKIRPVSFNEFEKKFAAKKTADDSHFKKLLLIVDPAENNEELILQNKRSTFVLRRNQERSSLGWINILGQVHEIDLKSYPDVTTWLQKHPEELSPNHIADLKKHLLKVKTNQEIDGEKLKYMASRLASSFGQPDPNKQKSNEPQIKVHFVDEAPDPVSLAEQGIGRSFIINHASKSLWWLSEYNKCNAISLAKYPELRQWLDTHTSPLNDENLVELQSLLAKVKTVDERKQNVLSTMLASRTKKEATSIMPSSATSSLPTKAATEFPQPFTAQTKQEFHAQLAGLFSRKCVLPEDEVFNKFEESMRSKSTL